jgi:hypothetical protein
LLKLVVVIFECCQNQSVGSQVSKLTTILSKQGMVLMQIALKDGQKGASLSGFDIEFVVVLSHEAISLKRVPMHNQRSKSQCYPTSAYLKSFSF